MLPINRGPVRATRSLLSFLFFVSGATGLVYEVLWAKRFSLFLGSTAWAQTTVLAAFLGGLALGNALFGNKADRIRSPLRLYAWLEIGIGIWGLLSPLLLNAVSGWYIDLARSLGAPSPASSTLRFLAAAVIMLPPTIMMGGTLPTLVRQFFSSLDELRREVAWFYAVNSLGAVFGTLLAGFYLIPEHGLALSFFFTGTVNCAIGAACLFLSDPAADTARARSEEPRRVPPWAPDFTAKVLLAAVFLSGCVSLVYEVAWIRLLTLVTESSAYSFSVMLAAFITGITIGSYAIEKGLLERVRPELLFAAAEIGIGVSIVATLPLFERLPYWFMVLRLALPATPKMFLAYQGVKFLSCFLVTMPPTILLGMTLPLASRGVVRNAGEVGGPVGKVFGLNAVGNVAGAIAAGLFLLPVLGIGGLIEIGIAANLVIGLAAFALLGKWSPARKAAAAGACALLFLAHQAWWSPSWSNLARSWGSFRSRSAFLGNYGEFVDDLKKEVVLLYDRDGASATITVTKQKKEVSLRVNGKADASTGADMITQVMLAEVPLLLRPGAREALVIGFGSGVTAGSALLHPLERLDVVEISPEVIEAEPFFRGVNNAPLSDPRLKLHIEDAVAMLRMSPNRYDVVISEPSNPWMAGIGNLFSKDFFRLVRARLNPGGIMVQWLQPYETTDDIVRLVTRTMLSEFPNVSVWSLGADLLLVGSEQALRPDLAAALKLAESGPIAADLARVGVYGLAPLLSMQTAGSADALRFASEGPVNTDIRPILEYAAPKAFFLDQRATLFTRNVPPASEELAAELLLPRYRAARGGLSSNELASLVALHERLASGAEPEFSREWLKRYPDQKRAFSEAVRFALKMNAPEFAVRYVRRLLQLAPGDARYLSYAAEMEFQRHEKREDRARTSYLTSALRYMKKAIAAGADAAALERRAAAVIKADGNPPPADASPAAAPPQGPRVPRSRRPA